MACTHLTSAWTNQALSKLKFAAALICPVSVITQATGNGGGCLLQIASTWEGIRACEVLQKQGIDTNMTLLFSFAQVSLWPLTQNEASAGALKQRQLPSDRGSCPWRTPFHSKWPPLARGKLVAVLARTARQPPS